MEEEFRCENQNCKNLGKLKCGKCKELRLSDCFGRYCGSECQRAHFPNHKTFHKIPKGDQKVHVQYVAWTALFAMKELQARLHLPSLSSEKSFALHLFGCRMDPEGFTEQYSFLFDCLKHTLFPELEKLLVTVSGPELIFPSKNKVVSLLNGAVIISFLKGRCETIAPTLDFKHGVAMTNNPGLSQYYDSWEPGMKVLIALGATTISTGFTGQFHTMDYAFEERTMATYFGAKILVPSTYNPARWTSIIDNTKLHEVFGACKEYWAAKAGFYFAFCGRDSAITPISKQQLIKENQLAILNDHVKIYDNPVGSSPHPILAEFCRRLVRGIESGEDNIVPADAHLIDVMDIVCTASNFQYIEKEPKYGAMMDYHKTHGVWSRVLWGV